MAIKLVLSSDEILNKVFPTAPRGYNAFEVDEFLDRIIKDYETLEANCLMSSQEIGMLNERIANLEKEKHNLEIELGKYKNRFNNVKPDDNVTEENIHLIKKINAYEKFLWNHGYNPSTIK